MAWWQLSFICSVEQVARLSQGLEDAGAIAVTLCAGSDEALCERVPGTESLWKVTRLNGLFPGTVEVAELAEMLEGLLAPEALPPCTVERVPDSDWSDSWKVHFKPFRIADRLWIGPSWHRPPATDTVNVVLDPGRAFGTGTHATTALCLEWLASAELDGADVIDYGCGSGILAIAAAKLGARHVFAVDIDPSALEVTRENASRNGVQGAITAVLPEALPRLQVDILVANILAEPLIALAPHFAALVRNGGFASLSGILQMQVDAVSAAYRPWFRVSECLVREGWTRIGIERSNQGE